MRDNSDDCLRHVRRPISFDGSTNTPQPEKTVRKKSSRRKFKFYRSLGPHSNRRVPGARTTVSCCRRLTLLCWANTRNSASTKTSLLHTGGLPWNFNNVSHCQYKLFCGSCITPGSAKPGLTIIYRTCARPGSPLGHPDTRTQACDAPKCEPA